MELRQLGWIALALAVAVAPASAHAQAPVRRAEKDGGSALSAPKDLTRSADFHDGDAACLYSNTSTGGAEIANRAGGTVSASSCYHAAGIYGTTHHGTLRVTNDGVVTAPVTASTRGPAAGQACASADASTGARAQAIYCGGNGGAVSFTNTGTVTASAGRGGGWGVGVENDEASPVTVVNRGSIAHDSGIGLALFTGPGPVTITNSGSISGGLYGIMSTLAGPVTLHDTGDIRAGAGHRAAVALGGGDDSVDISGLPTIVGVLDGGGGTNRLSLKLTGVLQSVDGEPATLGNDLAAYHLGTNGSIVVSGKTYAWTHFVVSGTVTGTAPPSPTPAPTPAPALPPVASTLKVK